MNLENLLNWYNKNARPLPWRRDKNPYFVWISEVMLQQTTCKAVIPYFENFIEKYPNVGRLAQASLEEVYQLWSGLGYYSRARNLHLAAQKISKLKKFPSTYEELLELPGFGPYTSRSVASIAFDQKVGVVDGNVIRLVCRWMGIDSEWWSLKSRKQIQDIVDAWAQEAPPSLLNQSLMELGATICSPQNPKCVICPVSSGCATFKDHKWEARPKPKPREPKQLLLWQPLLQMRKTSIALVQNNYAPFLKNQWIWPGKVKKIKKPPQRFDFKHTITKYDIYTQVLKQRVNSNAKKMKWVELSEISKISPTSLMKKSLKSLT